jgi:predicted deacylase
VVQHCDTLVDFHTGSFDRSNLPQVRADLRIPEVLEFTRGFGATTVLHSAGTRGMLRLAATRAGIPAVTFEVGGPGQLQPEEIGHGVQAIETLMHKLGMTRDLPTWQEPQPFFYDSVWVRSNAGGLLLSDVQLGQRVERGQRLGVVIDPINNVEREIVSPVFGRVIGKALNQVVLPGFAAYHLGEETSEQQAVREAATNPVSPVEEDPDATHREPDPESQPPDPDQEFEED